MATPHSNLEYISQLSEFKKKQAFSVDVTWTVVVAPRDYVAATAAVSRLLAEQIY